METCEFFEKYKLEEHTVYKVKVKLSENNVMHTALLFTGFKNGNYTVIYTNTYEAPHSFVDVYYMEVLEKLTKLR